MIEIKWSPKCPSKLVAKYSPSRRKIYRNPTYTHGLTVLENFFEIYPNAITPKTITKK